MLRQRKGETDECLYAKCNAFSLEKKEAAPSFTTTRVNPEGVTPVESVATGGHTLCDLTSPWAATSVQLDSWSKEQNGGTRDARKSEAGGSG